MTVGSLVNMDVNASGAIQAMRHMSAPKPAVTSIAKRTHSRILLLLWAPLFWAVKADTDESIDEGTRNMNVMSFSTIPTAEEDASPL